MNCPKVSIVVANWNGKKETLECLESLRQLDYANYDVIVVDNGSSDGSQSAIRNRFPDVTLIENRNNLGYGGAINSGIAVALQRHSDYVLALNNDLVLDSQSLKHLVEIAETDTQTGMTCPKLYWLDDPQRICATGFKVNLRFLIQLSRHRGTNEIDLGQWNKPTEVDAAGIFLVKRQVIETVGAFDPAYFLHLEDFDWCMRVRQAGFKIMYVPQAVMWHKGSVSMGGSLSPLVVYYVTRNRFRLWRLHFGVIQTLGLFLLFMALTVPIRTSYYLLQFKLKHLRFFFRGIGHGLLMRWGPA